MWPEELIRPMRLPLPKVHQDGTWTVSIQRVWLIQGLIPRMIRRAYKYYKSAVDHGYEQAKPGLNRCENAADF
jgi:TPR repeat protein